MVKLRAFIAKWRSSFGKEVEDIGIRQFLWRLVEVLPVAVPVGLAMFGLISMSLLLFEQFRIEPIWPLGLTASLAAMLLVYKYGGKVERPGGLKERRWCDILIIVGVLAWVGLNVGYASQHVFTDRDPAAYSVAGAWLASHDNLVIEKTPVFGAGPELESASSGFNKHGNSGDRIYAHGEHLLPVYLGAAGKIIKEVDIFKVNVLIGGIALLAVYAFARLFIRPRWALLAVAVMAMSLPMLYFSRDTYTEPLMMAFTFGSLALLFMGQRSGRGVLWLLAGILAGAAVATRIDASLNIIALMLFAIVVLALSKGQDRRKNIVNVSLLAAGTATASLVGLLDAIKLSPVYYAGHLKYLSQVLYAIVAMAILGLAVVLIAWRTKWLNKLDLTTKRWRGPAIFLLIILAMMALASRPLWFVDHGGAQFDIVPELQAAAGQTVEYRSYAEHTVNWLVWYLGLPVVVLGVVGLAAMAARIMSGRNLLVTAGILIIGTTALLYLFAPTITPDQIWASRRFLPVVMPGLAIFAAYTLDRFIGRFLKWWPRSRLLSLGLVLVILSAPLLTSWPFLRHSEKAQYASIGRVCGLLPSNSAVLWIGKARLEVVQPTRTFCGRPSMGYVKDSDFFDGKNGSKVLAKAAANARDKGYIPIVGVYGSQAGLIAESERKYLTVIDFSYSVLEQTLDRSPSTVLQKQDAIMLAVISDDGGLRHIKD